MKSPEWYLLAQRPRNILINGGLDVWQRGVSFPAASNVFTADRFAYGTSGSQVATVSQNADVPTLAQSGWASQYSLDVTVTTANASPGATDNAYLWHKLEGFNFQPIRNRKVTLSFWVKSSTTGTYACSFQNGAQTRSWLSGFTINSANTWEKKTVSVDFSLEQTGVWNIDNTIGMSLFITLLVSTSNQSATTNQWLISGADGITGQVNLFSSVSNYLRIAQIMLNEGGDAAPFMRAGLDIHDELSKCERYYETSSGVIPMTNLAGTSWGNYRFRSQKRASPTVNFDGSSTTAHLFTSGGDAGVVSITQFGDLDKILFDKPGAYTAFDGTWTADAEL